MIDEIWIMMLQQSDGTVGAGRPPFGTFVLTDGIIKGLEDTSKVSILILYSGLRKYWLDLENTNIITASWCFKLR